ncbi:MAG: ornithine carbamoyltransferase, partial [Gammaproteobacteria bacterium]
MTSRDFLSLLDFSSDELLALISNAIDVKQRLKRGISHTPLQGKVLAMIFEKSSTRTRVSFETGMYQLGGHSMFLSDRDIQLGRGEPIEDSSRVISSMVDGIMIRTFGHERVTALAEHASCPVINGLSDLLHPCQLLADMQTWFELRGNIEGATVAWIGDGNNMCHSYINAA